MSGRSLRITMKLVGEQEPRPKDIKTILTLAGYSSWPHVTSWGLEETANKYQVKHCPQCPKRVKMMGAQQGTTRHSYND